jgi:hypothetical protein
MKLARDNIAVMTIPELTQRGAERLLEQFIERRVSPRIRHKVRMSVETRGNNVTLFEHRPVFHMLGKWTNSKVAQFRYDPDSDRWTLYCSDRHDRWHRYTQKQPATAIAALLREVDQDPTGIFWG